MPNLNLIERRLTQHGNSWAIIVPREIMEILGWKEKQLLKVPFHLFEKVEDEEDLTKSEDSLIFFLEGIEVSEKFSKLRNKIISLINVVEVPYLSNNTGVFQIKYLINNNEFLDVIELGEKIIRLNPRISYYKVKDPKKIIEKRPANVPYWDEHCAINFNNNSNINDIMDIITQAYNSHR